MNADSEKKTSIATPIKCPSDLNRFCLTPEFEDTFTAIECKQARFYGNCCHCWATAIAKHREGGGE